MIVHLPGVVKRYSLAFRQEIVDICRRVGHQAGITLEAFPFDIDVILVLKSIKCGLEPSFADIAKRAHHVRPYFHFHFFHTLQCSKTMPSGWHVSNSKVKLVDRLTKFAKPRKS